MGVINVSRGSDHLRGLIRDSFTVVILGTFDGYPVGLICIAGAFSELSGMLSGGYCYGYAWQDKG